MGRPTPGQMWFSRMLFYYRNVRVTYITQYWSMPKAVLKCTFVLVETHSYDFSPPAIPWIAPPPGKCVFAHMLFYYRNIRVKNRTQCWSVAKTVIKCTFGLVETQSYDFGPPVISWVAPPPEQMWFSHIRFWL